MLQQYSDHDDDNQHKHATDDDNHNDNHDGSSLHGRVRAILQQWRMGSNEFDVCVSRVMRMLLLHSPVFSRRDEADYLRIRLADYTLSDHNHDHDYDQRRTATDHNHNNHVDIIHAVRGTTR